MTKSELVRLIGDVLTEIDVLAGSLVSGSPEREKLDHLRDTLDSRQRDLVKQIFQENDESYRALTEELSDTNRQMAATLQDLAGVARTLDLLTKFVGLVDRVASLAA